MNTCIILRKQFLEESLSSIIIRHTPSTNCMWTHYNEFLVIYNKIESSMPNKNSIPFFFLQNIKILVDITILTNKMYFIINTASKNKNQIIYVYDRFIL